MFVEFRTSNGIRVQVLEVSVLIHTRAHIEAYLFLPSGLTLAKLDMGPEEYAQWGADDNFIKNFICSKYPILGVPVDGEGGVIQTAQPLQFDDSRSVHNESDLNRISTLERELEEQKNKLATIMSLIGKTAI
jgi:hypothetical protein